VVFAILFVVIEMSEESDYLSKNIAFDDWLKRKLRNSEFKSNYQHAAKKLEKEISLASLHGRDSYSDERISNKFKD
jgi:ribosomal protein S20